MKVMVKEPGKPAEEREIENTLEELQDIVGGYVEAVRFNVDVVIWCHADGKLLGLEPNFAIWRDIVVGPVVITRVDEDGDCIDLTSDDCMEVASYLNYHAYERLNYYAAE